MKTLYCNADVLVYRNGEYSVLKNAYVGVDGTRFCYVGEEKPKEDYDAEKDMRGKLLTPAFYNCHGHSPMVLLRGVGSDLPLDKWLFEKVFPVEDRLTPECVRVGSDLSILEMIAGGTVSYSDMYFFPEQTANAAIDAGMKANVSRPVQAFEGAEEQAETRLREALELYDRYHKAANGRILVDFSVHAEYTCNEDVTRRCAELCNERGGIMHIHLSETVKEHEECKRKYGKTPAQVLLRFLIQSDVAVIPKSVHEARIRENIDIFDFELTADEMDALRKLGKAAPMIGNPEDPAKVEFAMTW